MKRILQKDASVLREKAKEIPIEDITSPKIQKIIAEMKEAMASQDDGVAIAAPQIGYSLQIFIVSHRVAMITKGGVEKDTITATVANPSAKDTVYINPILKKVSKEKKVVEEGCLSVRYLYGKVSRGVKATVEAYDETGKKFTKGGSGLLAQIFQHETDHLNGILFIDMAKHVEEIPPDKLGASN